MAPKTPFRRRTEAKSLAKPKQRIIRDIESIVCERCGDGEFPEDLLLCDKCDRGFHLFCLRPILACVPQGHWFCPSCSSITPKEFPLIQTKISDFFKIQRSPGFEKLNLPIIIHKKIIKKPKRSMVMAKKKRKLLAFNPCDDPKLRMKQMASLATALMAVGAQFSNELTYLPGMAPRSANRAHLERGGMQVLPKEDAETLMRCKKMLEAGEWPPLLVVFDHCEGFTVEAERFIRDLTIITEYVGDVDYLEQREGGGGAAAGDSMMTLLCANETSKSLVICPEKRSNIARFINGINNHSSEGKKKQNVKCIRFDVEGECRALLVASRDIKKGERLYYDYNAYEDEYPTHHFL